MVFSISNIIDLASVIAMTVMSATLLLVPKPAGLEWRPFRWSLYVLVLAFMVLAAANVPTAFTGDIEAEILGATVIGVSAYQALLFTAVTIVMLHPRSRFIKMISLQVGIITILSAVLLAISIMSPQTLFPWAMAVAIIGYFCMCAFFTKVFRDVYRRTLKRLEAYYDEDMEMRIKWMRRFFFSALFVGMLAIVASVWVDFYPFFTLIAIVFYVYLLSCMLRYIITASYLLKAVLAKNKINTKNTDYSDLSSPITAPVEQPAQQMSPTHQALQQRLDEWIQNREYTKTDIGVDEIALQLGTTYTELTHYFATVKGITFRNWRTQLRIEESKHLMKHYPDMSIKDIALQAGFNDRGNFHRTFQKAESLTPSEYRRDIV